MTTLAQARAALNEAHQACTAMAWQAAAVAFDQYISSPDMRADAIRDYRRTLAERRNAVTTAKAPTPKRAMVRRVVELKRASGLDSLLHVKHTGKMPVQHSARCTLQDGYSVRITIGQFRGETIADSLARLERFTIACYRAEKMCVCPVMTAEGSIKDWVPCRPWIDGARMLFYWPDVVDCRVVKFGSGPTAGVDLEKRRKQ